MKKINEVQLKKMLVKLEASKPEIELILNTAGMFNQMFEQFLAGDEKKVYICYQLNGQYNKQINELKKAMERKQRALEALKKKEEKINPPKDEDDKAFDDLMNIIKK